MTISVGAVRDCLNDNYDHSGELAMTDNWTVAEAKAKLSEVIEQARSSGPQMITRNGRKAEGVRSPRWMG